MNLWWPLLTGEDRKYARVRGIIGYVARKMPGITVNEIADYFSRDIFAISKGVTKIENGMISDVSLRKTIQEIETSAKEANEKKYANS